MAQQQLGDTLKEILDTVPDIIDNMDDVKHLFLYNENDGKIDQLHHVQTTVSLQKANLRVGISLCD